MMLFQAFWPIMIDECLITDGSCRETTNSSGGRVWRRKRSSQQDVSTSHFLQRFWQPKVGISGIHEELHFMRFMSTIDSLPRELMWFHQRHPDQIFASVQTVVKAQDPMKSWGTLGVFQIWSRPVAFAKIDLWAGYLWMFVTRRSWRPRNLLVKAIGARPFL